LIDDEVDWEVEVPLLETNGEPRNNARMITTTTTRAKATTAVFMNNSSFSIQNDHRDSSTFLSKPL
jgi:uncharacterized protein GlcG (DUF336 family)